MSTIAYGGCREEIKDNCLLPPPDLCGCEPVCEEECHCGPHQVKTHARDAIVMKRNEVERWFSLTEWGCRGHPIPAVINCIELVLRRKGSCKDLCSLTPIRATADANVQFRWPKWFISEKHGYYEGDIYINGREQHTVLLKLPKNQAQVDDTGFEISPFVCGDCCSTGYPDCVAVPDGQPAPSLSGSCTTPECESC